MSGTWETLVAETPASGSGVATRYGNWKLVVQVAIPNQSAAIWDVSTWGSPTVWSDGYEWRGIEDRTRGLSWRRGRAGIQGRPETGEAALTLANTDGAMSYWNASASFPQANQTTKPGTLARIGWYDQTAGDWQPAFTGVLDEAEDDAAERDGDLWISWTLIETTGVLSLIDEAAQDEQGTGETVEARTDRLLEASAWLFGTGTHYGDLDAPFDTTTLQATTVADNRLAEVYLTADSGFADAYSDRAGRLELASKALSGAPRWAVAAGSPVYGVSEDASQAGGIRYVPWTAAPAFVASNVDRYDSVSVARANGEQAASAVDLNLPVRSGYQRTDLLLDADDDLQAWADAWLANFAGNVVKIGQVGIDPAQSTNGMDAVAHLDAPRGAWLKRTNPRQTSGWSDTTFDAVITGYTVDVAPNGPTAAMSILATLDVAVRTIT